MRIWKNRSSKAYCCYCKKRIKYGEPCILIDTVYFWRGNRSVYLHIHCVDEFIKSLKEEIKENANKILKWKLEEKSE